jgi:hypothetical protein
VPSKETLRLQRLAAIRRRQRLAQNTDHGLVAVLRGHIEKKPEDDADVKKVWVMGKGFVSRTRVREAEEVEKQGQEKKKSKRAKV